MRTFKPIRCGAISNDGVFIDPHYSGEFLLYEFFGGEKYLIRHEICGDGHFFGKIVARDGAFEFEELNDPPNLRTPLPEELLNRFRTDLPKAYAAMGIGCIIQ